MPADSTIFKQHKDDTTPRLTRSLTIGEPPPVHVLPLQLCAVTCCNPIVKSATAISSSIFGCRVATEWVVGLRWPVVSPLDRETGPSRVLLFVAVYTAA